MRIIAATQNLHKIQEIEVITGQFGMHLVPMKEVVGDVDIEENGTTFEENSFIKADSVCKLTGEMSIADDSGLMVDYLDGAPGVYSARYSGVHGDDAASRKKILKELEGVPDEKRGAQFVCAITLVSPDGTVIRATGICPGKIAHAELGTGGFGYDCIFIPDGYDQTFGQLPAEIKNEIGHRGRALQKLYVECEKNYAKVLDK